MAINNHLMVSERSGLISIFDLSGNFLRRIRAIGVVHMNSSFSILNDSLLVIGGLREKAGDMMGGTLAHMYSWTGELEVDFSPVVDLSRRNKVTVLFGISCDADDSSMIWCVQIADYTIHTYSLSGELLGTLPVDADYFRPLRDPQPTDRALSEWILSWDHPTTLYTVNDSVLVAEVFRGQRGNRIDLINKKTGDVIDTRDSPGFLDYVNKNRQEFYFRLPAPDEPETRYLVISLIEYLESNQ